MLILFQLYHNVSPGRLLNLLSPAPSRYFLHTSRWIGTNYLIIIITLTVATPRHAPSTLCTLAWCSWLRYIGCSVAIIIMHNKKFFSHWSRMKKQKLNRMNRRKRREKKERKEEKKTRWKLVNFRTNLSARLVSQEFLYQSISSTYSSFSAHS